MYDRCFFDLDGTLTESGPGITRSVAYALERFGISVSDPSELNCYVGPPLIEAFQRNHGLTRGQAVAALGFYREYFTRRGMFENSVYPGVEEMLGTLRGRGVELFVVTSKPEEFARRILDHFGLLSFFHNVYGATMDEKRTEKADLIAYALRDAGIEDKGRVVMVGDRSHDVIGAVRNGIACIGVLYGYGSRSELEEAGAVCLAESAGELAGIISG